MKSSRHIFKLPLDIPIQKYDPKNTIHLKLAELGEKGQALAKESISKFIQNNKEHYTKFKIQNMLIDKLKLILFEIDEILKKEFHPT